MHFADFFGFRFELLRQIDLLCRRYGSFILHEPQLLDQFDGLGILRGLIGSQKLKFSWA